MDGKEFDKLLPEATRYLEYFQALTEVGKVLTSTLELNGVLDALMKSLSQLMRPEHWSLLLVDPATNELYFEVAVGPASAALVIVNAKHNKVTGVLP